ncbi:MAG: hypothetical protein ABIE07_02360 [Candidatus Zixiibacteriota bacterium]
MASNYISGSHLWNLAFQNKAIYFNFGTEDVEKYFNNFSLYVGVITNCSDEAVKTLDFGVTSTRPVLLFDIHRDYLRSTKKELNIENGLSGAEYLSKISLTNLNFAPNDSLWVVFISDGLAGFSLETVYADKHPTGTEGSVICETDIFRANSNRGDVYFYHLLAILLGLIGGFFMYRVQLERISDYKGFLDAHMANLEEQRRA